MLKPLHGDETGLYENLVSFCDQAYSGPVQIVFGVARPDDPADRRGRAAAQGISRTRRSSSWSTRRVSGTNPKVSNLINMSARIAHDIVVIADSDIRVRPDYLSRIVGALEQRGGAVTVPVLRHLDRQSVVAARRDERRGPFPAGRPGRLALCAVAAVPRLDHRAASEFARSPSAASRRSPIALPTTTRSARCSPGAASRFRCCRSRWGMSATSARSRELWRHEVRWAMTIRSIDPAGLSRLVGDACVPAGADRAGDRRRGWPRLRWPPPRSPAAGF